MSSRAKGGGAKRSIASKIVKPNKTGKRTLSTRQHRFEGFSQRIAKLKIDPVRRSRRVEDLSHAGQDHTYIGTSMEEWKDLNLSENFQRFGKEISPLVESLPMVIHHEDRILEILLRYIEKQDVHSLEPLLSLLAHFAHDLDLRFEKHFQQAVGTVVSIAAKMEAPEAIEWSFTCLAWLFKYLSRLLVPDLRPLFDLMKPFLGKEKQKTFIIRFAAEAMGFLMRRAGAAYEKSKEPLERITNHIVEDFVESQRSDLYAQGLMTLLTESIKGVQGTLHSGGNAVLKCLIDLCFDRSRQGKDESALQLLKGSLISVIHHTDVETFAPVFEALVHTIDIPNAKLDKHQISIVNKLLFTVVATRKGTRIANWSPIVQQTVRLVTELDQQGPTADTDLTSDILNTLALLLQTAPLDAVLSAAAVIDTLVKPAWKEFFLPFCYVFADFGQDRFDDLLLTPFQRWISTNWKDQEARICAILPAMYQRDLIRKDAFVVSKSWIPRMSEPLARLKSSKSFTRVALEEIALGNSRLELLKFMKVESDAESVPKAIGQGCEKVNTSILNSEHPLSMFTHGSALEYSAEHASDFDARFMQIASASSDYQGLVSYWKALHAIVRKQKTQQRLDVEQPEAKQTLESLINVMTRCLSFSSHELRSVVLSVLCDCYEWINKESAELLEVAQSIEDSVLNVESARFISSQIRRLTLGYRRAHKDPILAKAIPTYCFGILHLRLSQAWDDAATALKEMSEFQPAEDVISTLAAEWLRGSEDESSEPDNTSDKAQPESRWINSDFECSNMAQIEAKCAFAHQQCQDSEEKLRQRFLAQHKQQPLNHPFNRTQALKVLRTIPQLAEKRSRLLVPILLEWAGDSARQVEDDEGKATGQRWSRKDQKAMLEVFAQFVNPRVLFRSAEVKDALLALVMNGDVEIQQSSLKAVLAWKIHEVNRYQEHLVNLLDDARFREEISVFLHLGDEEGVRNEDIEGLMPVLLRLLYGRAVTRSGVASGARGQQSKRKAIFGALARFPESAMSHFIDIALAPILTSELFRNDRLQHDAVKNMNVNPRKQFGMLNMAEDMLDSMGSELEPFAKRLADAALLCLLKAKENSEETADDADEESHTSLYRSVRQAGYHCLIRLFDKCPGVDWTVHAETIMNELVGPRLAALPIETAQSVSGILRIFSAWAVSPDMAGFLVRWHSSTIQTLADCLSNPNAKIDVKLFVVQGIFAKLLDHTETASGSMAVDLSDAQSYVRTKILEPNARCILVRVGAVLRQNPPKELLDACVSCVARLSPLISGVEEIKDFVDIATYLLRQPPKRVSPKTKRDLLETLCHLIPACDLSGDQQRFDEIYQTTSPLFAYFRDRESRTLMCRLYRLLSKADEDLVVVADLCEDLNSFAVNRIEEPDFARRAEAFDKINEETYNDLSAKQWRPLLHNMLYYIRDNDELAIRTSASFSMRRFVQAAVTDSSFRDDQFESVATSVLLPGLQGGMRDPSELVRSEYLAVLAHLIKHCSFWAPVGDMLPLLANDDEEASFFANVLHIQQHRRLRALRRLASAAGGGHLSSGNVNQIFVPLVEHFVFDAAKDESAHNLTAEAVTALGALSQALDWQLYRTMLKRYIAMIKTMTDEQKVVFRLTGTVVDALYHAASSGQPVEDVEMTDCDKAAEVATSSNLSKTLPGPEKLSKEIISSFLPPLTNFLHLKDESTVSLRIPVAVTVVKLIRILPDEEIGVRLSSALLDVCHILRSRDQGARDMTRKTLTEITALLGASYFGFILKELRSSLQRGYQLHVLSFTVHSILVENINQLEPGDLDFCLPEIMSVIMDDIFGVAGQEKEAEEYISKMKEVKSSKSFDSMELISKITTLPHLSDVIRPIQTLLMEKLDLRTVKKIDELLRRIGLGITQNQAVADRDVLVFCYEVIQKINAALTEAAAPKKRIEDYKTFRYIVQMQSANKSSNRGATSSYIFKLTRFAFDLLRSVLQKHEELKTPANVAGFLPMASEALVGGQEETQLSAVRLLTSLMKVRSPKIEADAPVYAAEAVNIIRAAPSMTTEAAQAALKLVSAILRERPAVKIRETDIAYTLKRMKPDLQEPDRQGVIFNFLKAVLSRKIVITEVYEILDAVAAIMVTNQTRTARDLARGIYFQFFMDYPQGKERLAKQVSFLVKNLDYQYVEGRQSVLELLHLLLNKTHGEVVQDLSSMLFVPLIMMMANDEAPECREMAGALIGKILERADDERRKNYLNLLRTWLEQDEQTLLRRVALQGWTMHLTVSEPSSKDVSFLQKQINAVLPSQEVNVDIEQWELLYYALQTFAKISEKAPTTAISQSSKQTWTRIFRCLVFPHAWVKLSAARLTGLLFGDVAKTSQGAALGELPLVTSGNMQVTADELRNLCMSSLRMLEVAGVTEQLAAQTARNLVFLGRCFAASNMRWKATDSTNGTDADGDIDDSVDDASDADEVDDVDEDVEVDAKAHDNQTAISYLFYRLARILRRDLTTLKAPALIPKTTALQTMTALVNHLDASVLLADVKTLETLLAPLVSLTSPDIPAPNTIDTSFNTAYSGLQTLAQEALNLLQKKVGTGEFVKIMSNVQKTLRDRREERRVKRRIERVAEPEAAERRKRKKFVGKRDKRKERGHEARGRRRGW
ncbi:hypothetical protein MBLNU457_7490t1 [Dothideomycetes sp. NU457]